MAQLEIQNLTFTYPNAQKPCLCDISLSVKQGEFILLCGQSGSGKTTLLRHMKPLLAPHGEKSGRICYDGAPLCADRHNADIGFVMQNPDDQIVTDRVNHELSFGLESIGCEQSKMRLRVAEMASYFGIEAWFHRDTSLLSGGEKQLLNLASVLAMQPKLLLLDEPTAQLDPLAAADFLNTLHRLNRELGITVIISEHRLEEVFPIADRVIVMDEGCILADDFPARVGVFLFAQTHPMFSAVPTPLRVSLSCNSSEMPITVREGRCWIEQHINKPIIVEVNMPQFNSEVCLHLKNVWFRYEKDSPDILKGVTLRVPKGCIYAVVGGNGTGKSTLLKSICGICRPYHGRVEIFGETQKKYRKELFRNGLCMLPQDPKNLFSADTVLDELKEMDAGAALTMAELCELSSVLQMHPHDLSGGEQQRLALAKVLLTKPRFLLLDEPTKGLDQVWKKRFAEILCKLKQKGTTILLVSHDIEFCAEYADLAALFFDGQLITQDMRQRFFSQNSFYTTAAARMSRGYFENAVSTQELLQACLASAKEAP